MNDGENLGTPARNGRSGSERSVSVYQKRVASLPEELHRALATSPKGVAYAAMAAAGPWVVTGAGGSEGPARMLAELLVAVVGIAAVFRPPSAFLGAPEAGSVCVVSQHLSPHAAMVLQRSEAAPLRILISAEAVAPPGVQLIQHGPLAREDLLLPRVVGPELATLAVLRWIASLYTEARGHEPLWAASLSRVPAAAAAAIARAKEVLSPALQGEGLDRGALVLVATGELGSAAASGMAGRTAEALLRADATVFDVCAFAHGPYQSLYDAPMCIVALEGPDSTGAFDRLVQLPRPGLHRVVRFTTTLAAPLFWLEHGAALAALASAELTRRPRDLISWPGKGADAPLYDLHG
jgi:hypothetical protein